jgi:serine/threonine protein kinase
MHSKGTIIGNRFKIRKKLGEGSFGCVFKAKDLTTKHLVALKIDSKLSSQLQLSNEIHAYESLSGLTGIPKLLSSGRGNDFLYCAIELLSKTLSHQLKKKRNLSLGCVIEVSLQLLQRLEEIHESCYIHRDIKPSNLMTGKKKDKKTLFLIDFGLSKKYRDPVTKQHSMYGEDRQMIGNVKYASLNSHLGIEQSRRDDLESWILLAIDLVIGKLPWDDSRNNLVSYVALRMKSSLSIDQLCEGCPSEFNEIFKYIRSLHFEEKPNYEVIRTSLCNLSQKYSLLLRFDWIVRSPRRLSNAHLAVRKPKERRRGSENLEAEQLAFIVNVLNENHSEKSASSFEDSSSIGSGILFETQKTPEHSPQSSKGLTCTFSRLAIPEIKEGVADEEDCKMLERVDTIKHIYPEFRNKRVHIRVISE